MKPLFLTLLFALISLPQTVKAQVPCPRTIEEKLTELKVARPSVKEITVTAYDGRRELFPRYEVWVRLGNCRGHLAIVLANTCVVTTVYTTGSCRVTGVPSY